MKITEAWENRELVIENCKKKRACKEEFEILIRADNQIDFENVLLANFWWCVQERILEDWIPDELPECIEFNCFNRENLTSLPKLPKCKILDCKFCCNLTSLPELPECKELYCTNCKNLISLPELPKIEVLICDERLKK